jgi:hypothetical protein
MADDSNTTNPPGDKPGDWLSGALRAWAPMIASGYECPAASTVMIQAADEIERLREALKPFADNAEQWGKVTVGDFRRARIAISRSSGDSQ